MALMVDLRHPGLSGQPGVGRELVLLVHLLGRGDDQRLLQGLGLPELETHEGASVGDAGCQLGAVQQHAEGPAHAATGADDGVVVLLVLIRKLFPGNRGYSWHIFSSVNLNAEGAETAGQE